MSADTVCLNLPRVARPDSITAQRGEGGRSHPCRVLPRAEMLHPLRHLPAGDLLNLGPISTTQRASVTAAAGVTFIPASERGGEAAPSWLFSRLPDCSLLTAETHDCYLDFAGARSRRKAALYTHEKGILYHRDF